MTHLNAELTDLWAARGLFKSDWSQFFRLINAARVSFHLPCKHCDLFWRLPSEIQEMPDTLPKLSEACKHFPSVTFALAPSDALEGATLEHATQSIAKHAEGGQRFFKLVLPTTSRSDGNITSATASADMSSRTCWFCTLQATQECQE